MAKSSIKTIVISGVESIPANINHLVKEQETALNDLVKDSFFQPENDNAGPYDVTLAIEDHRLVIYLKNANDEDLSTLILSLKPYKRLIQDYFLMIQSYEHARHEGNREKLEAIDMGRRGVHNEGAELFMERLKNKINMDFETARKLFTLICVLNKKEVLLSH